MSGGPTGHLSRVRVFPRVAGEVGGGVWSVVKRVVLGRPMARRDEVNFSTDRQHCVTESIEFRKTFAFGALEHQRSGNRKRHC